MTNNFSKTPATSNTVISDLNELLVGFILNKEIWFSSEAKVQHDLRLKQVTAEQYADTLGKASVMADEFLVWAKKHKYSNMIKKVWWTARPGSMTMVYGQEVNQKKNPTDILVQFSSGPDNGFLGLSAKSTQGKGDIGFKNPGLGTIEKSLKISLVDIVYKQETFIVKSLKLSPIDSQRKQEIRKKKGIQVVTQKLGGEVLLELRNTLYDKLNKLNQEQLLDHIKSNWLDSDTSLPKYVKVTGIGNKPPYAARVEDPLNNDKLDALVEGPIKLEKRGNTTVLVVAGGKNIMKMRWKWASEPLASSMKLSGDPA